MKLFAVTGNPILFSRSPNIFNPIFEKKRIDAYYTRITAQSAKEAINLFKELGLSGMSVTAPFKTDIIEYLDQIDELAREIGSVNTVILKNKKLLGYNTDYYGIINSLGTIKNKTILLIGAGGAAKAVAYSIQKNGGFVNIYNRTQSKAENIAAKYSAEICLHKDLEKVCKNADIIINTVPTGIKILKDKWFHSKHVIFDAIYHNSVYKNVAKRLNAKFISGETWLKNQAIPTFKLFFNDINLNLNEIEILPTKPKNKIILTGFMGSGKSIIGEHLSKKINYKFFNTDTIIEKKEGLNINKIFEKNGEIYFRKIEQEILNMLSDKNEKAIISAGGGVVLNKQNRKLISENYLSIWLYANSKTIMQRTRPDNRPLLKNNFNLAFVQKMMLERKNFYAKSADIIINTSDKNIQQIIKLIEQE